MESEFGMEERLRFVARVLDALISAVLEFGAQRSSPNDGLVPQVESSPPLAM